MPSRGARWHLREIVDHPQPAPMGSPNPWLAGFNAFGSLAEVCSVDEAKTFLEVGRGLVPREAGRYNFTDEAHVGALIGIGRAHVELRATVVGQMVDALLVDQRMAERVLCAGDLLRAESTKPWRLYYRGCGTSGNVHAALHRPSQTSIQPLVCPWLVRDLLRHLLLAFTSQAGLASAPGLATRPRW